MTKVYFARHGESDWNIIGRIQGQYNSNLTDKGLKQGELLAKSLLKKDIDCIYSSDLDRAYNTGKKLSDLNKIEIIKDIRLREMSFGNWEGKVKSEIDEDQYRNWISTPEDFKIPGGESLEELRIRIGSFLEELIAKENKKNILIVSHGAAIKMGILYLLKAPNSMYKNLSLNNVGLSLVEVRDFNNVLRFYNDTSHLGDK